MKITRDTVKMVEPPSALFRGCCVMTPTGFWHQTPVCPHLGPGGMPPRGRSMSRDPLVSCFPSLPLLKRPFPASELVMLTSFLAFAYKVAERVILKSCIFTELMFAKAFASLSSALQTLDVASQSGRIRTPSG